MDKMALFVEGQTEQEFVKRLIEHIAGTHKIHVDTVKAFGGKKTPRKYVEVTATKRPHSSKKYYVLIYDCTNDSRVLSEWHFTRCGKDLRNGAVADALVEHRRR